MPPDAPFPEEPPPRERPSSTHVDPLGGFPALLRELRARGCLTKQAGYYTKKILVNLILFSLSVAVLVAVHSPVVQVANAVFFGFVYVQVGMVVHDLGHRQGYRAARTNDLLGVLLFNLQLGVSYRFWLSKHAAHHRHPNCPERDPDLGFPFAYTEEQARAATGLRRLLVRHQAYLFLPMISLGLLSLRVRSARFLLTRLSDRRFLAEAVLTPVHYALYLGLLFLTLPPAYAVAFVLLHNAAAGVYLGLVFSTNHVGMPTPDAGGLASYPYRQVATARNIAPHPVTDYLFGPLRCQIEHHLCPAIPVNKLREAQGVVRPFCASQAIPYHETGAGRAIREVVRHLGQIGRAAR